MYKSAERKNLGKPEDIGTATLIGKRPNGGSINVSSSESQQQNIIQAKSNSKKVTQVEALELNNQLESEEKVKQTHMSPNLTNRPVLPINTFKTPTSAQKEQFPLGAGSFLSSFARRDSATKTRPKAEKSLF